MKKTIILLFALAMGLQFAVAQTMYNVTFRCVPDSAGVVFDVNNDSIVTNQTIAYPEGDDIILYVDVNWDLYDSANLLYYTVGGVYHSRPPQQGSVQGFSTIIINNVRGDSVCVFYFSGRRIGLTTDISVPVVKLQPNPAASFATITIEGANGEVDYSLIDLSGRIIRHKTVNAASAERIDLSGLANGTYFVRVTNENFSKVEKLVVSGQ